MGTAAERREELKAVWEEARGCVRCPQLAAARTTVVFGSGNADADLMFVGEAPGANEDKRGLPFVGQAGRLLERLLEEIGLQRSDVFIANVLKCRPPGNRDPLPSEIESCSDYLRAQLELIRPKVVCTLGNFATKLLREDPTGITRLHGRAEVREVMGARTVRLLPLFHPAAALYTPSMVETVREDFARLPAGLPRGRGPLPPGGGGAGPRGLRAAPRPAAPPRAGAARPRPPAPPAARAATGARPAGRGTARGPARALLSPREPPANPA